MQTEAHRYHDFSYGHRVVGHEGKCRLLHGHNGRVHFYCASAQLDTVGRVIDFGVMKSRLCEWLEEEWDHRFLMWDQDPLKAALLPVEGFGIVPVPFNPTAENLAAHLLSLGPELLRGTDVRLVRVRFEETRKCGATVELGRW